MKQTEEKIPEYEKASWEEFDKNEKDSGKYLRVEPDKSYMLMLRQAILVRDNKYKDRHGNPKMKVIMTLASINSQPTDKVFETGSFSIMREVRKAMKEGKLERSVFLLKKKQTGDRIEYVFEKVEEREPLPLSKEEKVGAFL